MIRAWDWPHITRAIVHAHYFARASARAVVTSLCASIEMQAHRQLCNQLRDLAARIVIEPVEDQ